jgi:hypothetical protein
MTMPVNTMMMKYGEFYSQTAFLMLMNNMTALLTA